MVQPASKPSSRTNAEWTAIVKAQMKVLNDSFSGATGGADSPFRFDLQDVEFVKNDAWYTVTPGKTERDMKRALHRATARR